MFDFTAGGDEINARIVSSDQSCFNREAVRTAPRRKFPHGSARRDVFETFTFALDG
jgi:hypothetical protein